MDKKEILIMKILEIFEDKDVVNRIIIPAIQSTLVGGFTFAVGITAINTGLIKDYSWQASFPISILAGGLHFIYACNQTIPKKYRQVSFMKTVNRASGFAQESTQVIPTVKAKTWVLGNGWGEEYSPPIDVRVISRIGWHYTYLDGRLTHPYLVIKWEMLKRQELEVLQFSLVERGWAKWTTPSHKGGIRLIDKGSDYFRAYSRLYKADEHERGEFAKKYGFGFGRSPTLADKLEIARRATGRYGVNIHSTNIVGNLNNIVDNATNSFGTN